MQENVRPQLDGKAMSREDISYGLRNFTDHDEHVVFWGYFRPMTGSASSGCSAGMVRPIRRSGNRRE
jgi:hypothetical protein